MYNITHEEKHRSVDILHKNMVICHGYVRLQECKGCVTKGTGFWNALGARHLVKRPGALFSMQHVLPNWRDYSLMLLSIDINILAVTLPETNSSPRKIGHPKRNVHLPTMDFEGRKR